MKTTLEIVPMYFLSKNKKRNSIVEAKIGDQSDFTRLKDTYFLARITVTADEVAIINVA